MVVVNVHTGALCADFPGRCTIRLDNAKVEVVSMGPEGNLGEGDVATKKPGNFDFFPNFRVVWPKSSDILA